MILDKAAQAAAQASNNLGLSMALGSPTRESLDHFAPQASQQQQQQHSQGHQRTSSVSSPTAQTTFSGHPFASTMSDSSDQIQTKVIRRSGTFSPFSPDPGAASVSVSTFEPSPTSGAGYDTQSQIDTSGQFPISYQYENSFLPQQHKGSESRPFAGGPFSLYSYDFHPPPPPQQQQSYSAQLGSGESEDPRFDPSPSFHTDNASAGSSQRDVSARGSSLSVGGYSAAPGPPSSHSSSSRISPPELHVQTSGVIKPEET